ncbi:MAG: class II aldolase/adducin family protein [Limnochordia bacterium]|jgi:L-fuculose-phosphate aldolase
MVALEPQVRRDLVATGQELAASGLVASTHGSLSARLDSDLILITPSGVSKSELTRESAVKISLSGTREYVGAKPSSALPIHRALYAATTAAAVVHALPPKTLATLQAVSNPLAAGHGEHVRVGTLKVLVIGGDNAKLAAQTVEASLGDAQAVCVDALGVFVWADNLALALSNMESLEEMAVSSSGDAAQRSPAPRGDENERESVAAQATKVAEDAVRLACPAASSASQTLSEVCNACGTCSNSGGSVPSAQYELALQALQRLTEDELVALVVEATREVLAEKGLL